MCLSSTSLYSTVIYSLAQWQKSESMTSQARHSHMAMLVAARVKAKLPIAIRNRLKECID